MLMNRIVPILGFIIIFLLVENWHIHKILHGCIDRVDYLERSIAELTEWKDGMERISNE